MGTFLISRNHYAPGLRLGRHVHPNPYVPVVMGGRYLEVIGVATQACTTSTVVYHPAAEEHSNNCADEGATVLSIYGTAALSPRSFFNAETAEVIVLSSSSAFS